MMQGCLRIGSSIAAIGRPTTSAAPPGDKMASVHVILPGNACFTGVLGRAFVGRDAIARNGGQSSINDCHCSRPTGGAAANLHWKAAHHEAVRRERLEIMQLFNVTIADIAPCTMAFPDQRGIMC